MAEQACDATKRAKLLQDLRQAMRDQVTGIKNPSLVLRLVDYLFESPVISIPQVTNTCKVSYPTAKKYVDLKEPKRRARLRDGGFITIPARNTMGRDLWLEFLPVRKEAGDDTRCVLADRRGRGEEWVVDERAKAWRPEDEPDDSWDDA